MAEKPVARLILDSRSFGPAYCEKCEDELEEVLLMTDASVACPDCLTKVEGFDELYNVFTSVQPLKPYGSPAKVKSSMAHVHDDRCRSYGCTKG